MLNDYIILDIGKIVIKRDINTKKYYKEKENKLCELDEKELEYINNIFDKYSNYKYSSEKLINLVNNNDGIEIKYKEYITEFLKFLESIIPENSRDNLYQNVKNIQIELNFDSNYYEDTKEDNNNYYHRTGGYDVSANSINIEKDALKTISKIAMMTKNPNDYFSKEVGTIVLHELCHMASSNYNKDTGIALCGFDMYPSQLENNKNRGLTEGMTEVITYQGLPTSSIISSKTFVEILIINQLYIIVGFPVLLESYFSNHGTKKIEEQLNKINDDKLLSNSLFRRIEDNFQIREENIAQNILSNIQMTLIDYFKTKIIQEQKEGTLNEEEIKELINEYEQKLITKQILQLMKKDPEQYIGIQESIDYFLKFKTEILENKKNSNSRV